MRTKNNKRRIYDRDVYKRKSKRGWAIVIMPDNIRIDNYHGFTNIHFSLNGKHEKIKYDDFDEIYRIIKMHILLNKGINKKLLRKELIWLKSD